MQPGGFQTQHSDEFLSEYTRQCPTGGLFMNPTVSMSNLSIANYIIYHLTSYVSSLAQVFPIESKAWDLTYSVLYLHSATTLQTHTQTVQCIHTGQNNIRLKNSEKGRFPAVENMLSSAAHLSLNRIIKSWGGWRGEGGDGTMLRACGRMWGTEGKMERRGRNRSTTKE